jgi:hypothetical protein
MAAVWTLMLPVLFSRAGLLRSLSPDVGVRSFLSLNAAVHAGPFLRELYCSVDNDDQK